MKLTLWLQLHIALFYLQTQKKKVRMHISRDKKPNINVSTHCLPADEQSNTDSWANYCLLKCGFLALLPPLVL
jgi:hypothetical protein